MPPRPTWTVRCSAQIVAATKTRAAVTTAALLKLLARSLTSFTGTSELTSPSLRTGRRERRGVLNRSVRRSDRVFLVVHDSGLRVRDLEIDSHVRQAGGEDPVRVV